MSVDSQARRLIVDFIDTCSRQAWTANVWVPTPMKINVCFCYRCWPYSSRPLCILLFCFCKKNIGHCLFVPCFASNVNWQTSSVGAFPSLELHKFINILVVINNNLNMAFKNENVVSKIHVVTTWSWDVTYSTLTLTYFRNDSTLNYGQL